MSDCVRLCFRERRSIHLVKSEQIRDKAEVEKSLLGITIEALGTHRAPEKVEVDFSMHGRLSTKQTLQSHGRYCVNLNGGMWQ